MNSERGGGIDKLKSWKHKPNKKNQQAMCKVLILNLFLNLFGSVLRIWMQTLLHGPWGQVELEVI